MNKPFAVVLFFTALAALALLQGCAAASTACRTRPATSPGFERTASDGLCLSSVRWEPARPPVRGVVVLIHGLRDYSDRYGRLAEALQAQGFAVVAQDHRGHGHSGGDRQRMESMQQLVDDVGGVVQDARARHPDVPVVVFGHSMGGLIATHYVLQHGPGVSGLILSGAGIVLPPGVSGFDTRLAKIFGTLLPGLPAQDLDSEMFLHDGPEKERFLADPLITHERLPAGSAKALIASIEALEGKFQDLKLPLLVVHGGEDVITSIDGSRALVAQATSTDKRLIIYEGQRHDLAHEPDAAKVVADIVSWVEAHIPPSAAAH
ncbi:lysophospholipase [Myxococcus sp. K38C18041901]|uniref:alpha/beta hydrolase n=1 Tax=Myxococcus guangdongensis TaxID=2906760 RepID=UPI0020A703D4|nr:alpha/beta hydrolase [Myxococcus guangdongensis]MCP3060217.1 lysophospholipase [Myxococcus guangdongensis]